MRFSGVFLHVFLIATGFIMVAPFLWMVSTALKGPAEIFVYPPRWLPEEIHLENFARAWQAAPFGRFYLNSIVVTLIITISQVATASLAAYVFARLNFPGRDMIFYLYVATLIIPIQVTIIPLYLILNALGWLDTYQGLTVPFLANAFTVFFLRQFFLTIPRELEDAARIDGCGRLRFLWQIMIPLARPALATITLFVFLSHWDDYLWPLIVTNSTSMRTLPIGLRYFVSEAGNQFHYMMAAALMAVAPVLAVFFAAQKQFIEGISLTGLKG